MASRYIVFDTSILTTEFQAYLVNPQAGKPSPYVGTNIAATPNGQYRTDNFALTLAPAATVVSTATTNCLVFLNGVTGTTTDFYQLNLTCTVQSSTSAKVTAVAYPSTVISSLTYYLLIWDTANLAIKSEYFVDYAITTTYYGTQKTFFSLPYGYLDFAYLGGISSFSYNNNQDLNITLSSQLVYTSSTSLYDSVPQFQVRLRVCAYSSPYYNTADGLCYPICPSYTFGSSSTFICSACPTACKACLNTTVCTSCSTGFVVSSSSSTCVCSTSSYLNNGTCYGCDYSCLTCAATGQYYNCLTCDSATAFRTPVAVTGFNFQCSCMSGYTDKGATVCSDICGDGIVKNSACDDGNTASGDGCSSTCTI
jgi:cysteine-rich repeat protein